MNKNHRCQKCSKHFKLDQSKKKCIQCGDHCLECNFIETCDLCHPGFFPNYNTGNFYYLEFLNIL